MGFEPTQALTFGQKSKCVAKSGHILKSHPGCPTEVAECKNIEVTSIEPYQIECPQRQLHRLQRLLTRQSPPSRLPHRKSPELQRLLPQRRPARRSDQHTLDLHRHAHDYDPTPQPLHRHTPARRSDQHTTASTSRLSIGGRDLNCTEPTANSTKPTS
jgi:hypothetical protein